MTKKQYRNYISALIEFIRIIRLEYQPGDRIPPSEVMAKRLDISRSTYTKVLAEAAQSNYVVLNSHQAVRIPEKSEQKVGIFFGRNENRAAMVSYPLLAAELFKALYQAEFSMEVIYQLDAVELIRSNVSVILVFPNTCPEEQWQTLKETSMQSGIPVLYLGFFNETIQSFPGCFSIYNNPEYAVYELHLFLKENQFRSAFVLWAKLTSGVPDREITFFPAGTSEKTVRKFCSMMKRRKPDAVFLEIHPAWLTEILSFIDAQRTAKWNPAVYFSSAVTPKEEKLRARFPNLNFRGTAVMDQSIFCLVVTSMIQKYFADGTPFQTIGVNNFVIHHTNS